MILNLKNIFDGEESISFEYVLDLKDFETVSGEYPFKEPVKVKGSVTNRAGVANLIADVNTQYYTQCDRCLKDILRSEKISFENILAREAGTDASDDIIVCKNDTLDLDELVTTNIILDLPMKNLCSEDCKGLCISCGKNLNEGDCGCKKDYINPQFAQLEDLIK